MIILHKQLWFQITLLNTNILQLYDIKYQPIGIMVRVFAGRPWDWGSITDQVIRKTQKMVLDASLLNTQHYKV